jgi:hypothetical protein
MKKWIAVLAIACVAGLGVFTMTSLSADGVSLGCEVGMPGC